MLGMRLVASQRQTVDTLTLFNEQAKVFKEDGLALIRRVNEAAAAWRTMCKHTLILARGNRMTAYPDLNSMLEGIRLADVDELANVAATC